MKKLLIAAAAVAALTAGAAHAGDFTYNLDVTSDYVFRGVSQTNAKPAVQGGIDYAKGLFYAGTWASTVDFANGYELDLYAGVRPVVGKTSFDFGVLTYQYGESGVNTTELKAAVSHPLGKGTIGAAYFHNVDYGSTFYYEVNASYPITEKLSVSGAAGEQDLSGIKYSTGNIGLTYAISPTWSLDARYSDTNLPEIALLKTAKPRVSVTLKTTF
ncbi:TorF family putative porin [Asticcacaulis solisilvae]|uniref:TorF family putative porin n=1 Tax=Asticcacaulis solisilvae TaxID=1217274 RepID=UPI003FD7B20F